MLHHADSALQAWLSAGLPAGVEIAFDAPGAMVERSARPRRRPALNLFLYEIGEVLDGQASAGIRLRGPDGRIAGTVLPVRRYRLTYLVTAWSNGTADEHELLGSVLTEHAERPVLGPQQLPGTLGALDEPLPIRLGWHASGGLDRDVWHALGVPLRTALDLSVVVPVIPSRIAETAPLVRVLDVDVSDVPDAEIEHVPLERRTSARRWNRVPRPDTDTGERR